MPGTTTTFTWSNPSSGDWTVPADWGATSFPNSTTAIAVIALAGSYTVSLAGTDPAITVGGLSITDTSAELSITNAGSANVVDGNLLNAGTLGVAQGGSLTVSGNLTSTGALLWDGDTYSGEGGSLLTVTGTLTNSGGISIGPPWGNLTANDTLSVGALAGTANVGLFGSASQANFLTAAAAPTTLNYNLSLYSDALVQYGSGLIGTIASGVTLLLDGPDAHVSDAGATTTDSALTGLTENDGTLRIVNGASVAIAGNLDNVGSLLLDGDTYTGEGGSILTVAGTLTNSGGISFGPPFGNLTANDTLSVGALAGTASVGLFGSASQANFLVAAAAPATLNYNLSLYGDPLMQFATGEIGTIASAVSLLLDGPGTGNDTINVGDASQLVFGSTGTLAVLATAAQAGAAVYGTGGITKTTLDITTTGTVTLNSGDKNPSVALANADTLAMPFNTAVAVQGGGGNDTLIANTGLLHAGQIIAPSSTTSTLVLQGTGFFDLRQPTTLSGIQTVDAEGTTPSQGQFIWLRNGVDLTLDQRRSSVRSTTTSSTWGRGRLRSIWAVPGRR
jgi:fibronectin-binding autotransporter adhesin